MSVAAFLLAMPMIYFWSPLLAPTPGWMLLEVFSLLLFIAMAIFGYYRSVTLLALGIIGHGFVQDLPHYLAANVIPQWYSLGCFVIDVCFGLAILIDKKSEHWDAGLEKAGV